MTISAGFLKFMVIGVAVLIVVLLAVLVVKIHQNERERAAGSDLNNG